MSGPELFDAWMRGDFTPPIAATLGFDLASHSDGAVEIVCPVDEFHYNPYGTAHGGLAATLLDTATGCAVHTRLPAGAGYATVNLNVTYLRPATVSSGEVRAVGRLLSMSRRLAVAEGELYDSDDRLLATGGATCLLMGLEKSSSD